MVEFLFGYFSVVIVIVSVLVVTSRNPVHSVLWMLLLFFHIAGVYLLLNAEFLAATQVIVYAGAILVLFLFTIMLLDLREEIRLGPFTGGWPAALAIALAVLITVVAGIWGLKPAYIGPWGIKEIQTETHTKALGKVLFTEYLVPFEIASVVLLVAIVGAVVLAKKKLKT